MGLFKTTYTIDEQAFIELKKHFVSPKDKNYFKIVSIAGFVLAILGIVNVIGGERDSIITIMILAGLFAGITMPILYLNRIKQIIKINMDRFKEAGHTEIEVTTFFTDDKIELHNVTTGASSSLDYSVICRFVETENMYVLFTRAEQFIVVDKASLISAQTNDEFIRFIREKCRMI